MTVTLIPGDAQTVLSRLGAATVQCCVTSPPYYGLRTYLPPEDPNHADEIGHDLLPDCLAWARQEPPCGACYVCSLRAVFAQVWRVLKPNGTLWLNLGDSYANDSPVRRRASEAFETTFSGGLIRDRSRRTWRDTRLPMKSLIGIPWRVALALQADGWLLRSDVIWAKPNPMPEAVRDRPTRAHEYVFLLARGSRYAYDSDAISEPSGAQTGRPQQDRARALASQRGLSDDHLSAIRAAGITDTGKARATQRGAGRNALDVQRLADEARAALGGYYREFTSGARRNCRTVWSISVRPYAGAHFAVMPEALAERCMLAGSQPGDLVLDPFVGAGTVPLVADRLGRHAIGIDLNPAYLALARERIAAQR